MQAPSDSALAIAAPARHPDVLSPAGRRALTASVLLAHVAGAWGLLQTEGVRQAVAQAAPVMVEWIAPAARPTLAPPPPPAVPRPTPTRAPVPAPVIAAPAATTPPPWVATTPLSEAPVAVLAAAPPTPASPAAPPAPPAPPAAPKPLPSSAIQYLVPPALVVPMASRRLNEQGTVWLRLVVDTNGLPQQVSLHQSSGFKRLDDQALQAMRAARFRPYTEHGVALEWTAIAPLAYELE